MLNKKDPLIDAIQQVMQSNQADRDAVKAVNEKFGIQDRRVLPHERQGEWDAAYQTVLNEASSPPMYNVVHKEHGIIGTHQHGKGFTPSKPKLGFKSGEVPNGAKIDHSSRVGAGGMMNKSISKTKKSMDEELHGDQDRIDVASTNGKKKPDGKLTSHDFKHLRSMEEAKKMKGDDPCWDNYEMIGMKKGKGGKEVPNCVPVKEQMADPYAEGQASSITTVKPKTPAPKATSITQDQKNALTNKIKSIKEAKKASMCESNNEGFNDRHNSSVNASVNKQVVAEAAKARSDYGLGAAAAPKDAAADRAKIDKAMEPVVNVTKAVIPGATAVDKLAQGDYKGAAVDAGISLAGGAIAGGAVKAGKAIYNAAKGTTKVATGTEKAATSVANALPTSAPVKPVSQAAREPAAAAAAKTPTAVDNFISKAKSTPVSPAAKEGGSAASKAAANVSKYNKPGTAGGRFSDNLAKARKGSENYGPSKGGVAVRKTTEPATVTRPGVPAVTKKPGVPAVANKPGVPAVANKPGVPAVANRPGLPATVGSAATKVASQTGKSKLLGRLGKAAVATAVGGAMYGLSNKNSPDSAGATPATGSSGNSGGSAKPTSAKPVTAKPTSAKPVAASPAASAVKSRLQTRDQRDNTIGASGRPTKGPGGVTSGTKTGKTITNRPVVGKKAPVGTGRVK